MKVYECTTYRICSLCTYIDSPSFHRADAHLHVSQDPAVAVQFALRDFFCGNSLISSYPGGETCDARFYKKIMTSDLWPIYEYCLSVGRG